MSGFRNKPKILRGAFVEYGLSIPPLFVVFQFNPVELSRSRSVSYSFSGMQDACTASPNETKEAQEQRLSQGHRTLRDFHQREEDLLAIREQQEVSIQEESISFELRLDATDDLDRGDAISEQFGILPRLATLELMMHPKEENLLGGDIGALLGLDKKSSSFTDKPRPPLVLFIWGRTRVLPVNLESMSITETEFGIDLHPIRATVSVSMTVIEGQSAPYVYSKALKEAMSVLNLANLREIADVVIPG